MMFAGTCYFFFFLADFFAFFAFFAFLAIVSSVIPKVWFNASQHRHACIPHYTIITKLILGASKKVNDGHTVAAKRVDEAPA
jgi:hypothetical protein